MHLQNELKAHAEKAYADFSSSLTPTVDRHRFIGVRLPVLRKISRQFQKENDTTAFMSALKHASIEEDLIHAFLINDIMEMTTLRRELKRFLPYVDNWLVCDALRPKLFYQQKEKALCAAGKWMRSKAPYTVRFGIEVCMVYGLDEAYRQSDLRFISFLESDQYYIQMMQAWYLATALIAHEADVLRALPAIHPIVRKMTIRKVIDSHRLSDELKEKLRRTGQADREAATGNKVVKVRK